MSATSGVIRLTNVRISYPQIFVAKAMQAGQEEKFSASFILNKKEHAALIALMKAEIEKVLVAHYGTAANVPKGIKLCLKDGIEKEDVDGYGPDVKFVTSSNKRRPVVCDRDKTPLTAKDDAIYPGCRVNATITLWVQDNSFGKKVNANLRGVQFVADDEEFGDGGGNIDAETEFDALPDADVLG